MILYEERGDEDVTGQNKPTGIRRTRALLFPCKRNIYCIGLHIFPSMHHGHNSSHFMKISMNTRSAWPLPTLSIHSADRVTLTSGSTITEAYLSLSSSFWACSLWEVHLLKCMLKGISTLFKFQRNIVGRSVYCIVRNSSLSPDGGGSHSPVGPSLSH